MPVGATLVVARDDRWAFVDPNMGDHKGRPYEPIGDGLLSRTLKILG